MYLLGRNFTRLLVFLQALELACLAGGTGGALEHPSGISAGAVIVSAGDSFPIDAIVQEQQGASTAMQGSCTADPAAVTSDCLLRRSRGLLATYPSSISNGSASANFPASAFASWCASDAACTAAGSLTLSLPYYTDASPYTSATLNWPNVFSGTGVSALQLVSGVVELQPGNYSAKLNQLICDASTTCVAQLSLPLISTADLSQSFVCLRLEPSVTGNSYQAYGYPPGSDGTTLEVTVVNGAMRCNTNRFGKHIIMQYKVSAAIPPSPSPPPSPPPLSLMGATYEYDVNLRMLLPIALAFDALKANATLLSDLTASLESSLAASLTSARSTLLLASSSNITSAIYKISRSSSNSTGAVSVDFRLVVLAGATQGQVSSLVRMLASNTTDMFYGSSYTSYFTASASVLYLSSGQGDGLSNGAVIAIALCSCLATLLVLGAAYGIYRWRAYAAILPKKPEGPWDATGVALVPRTAARRRKHKQDKLDLADDAGGESAYTAAPPPPPAGTAGAVTPQPPWEKPQQQQAYPSGGAPTAEGRLFDDSPRAPAATGGTGGLKSQAQLGEPARSAWG